jgi:hypothetical protein
MNTWAMLISLPGHNELPGRIENVSTAATAFDVLDRVERAAGGEAFLVRIEDYIPNGSDNFLTRGNSESKEEWEFAQPGGQPMWLPKRSFTDAESLKHALGVYLVTRKLWRKMSWEPVPDPRLLTDDPGA